jgi:hypothetical protein
VGALHKLRLSISEEVLGKKTQHKEWISSDTIKRIEKRKEKKATLNMSRKRAAEVNAQEEYATADRDVETSVKKDKKDYIEELSSQTKNVAGQGDLKDL